MRHRRNLVPRCGRQTRDIDAHVGRRIQERRRDLDISQAALARAIRLSPRQVQSYESGAVRLSPATLAAIAELLGAPISYFFVDRALDAQDAVGGEAEPDRRRAGAARDGD